MIRFELPTVPPPVNDERRAHWTKRHAAVRAWKDKTRLLILAHELGIVRTLRRDTNLPCIITHTFECRGDGQNREKYATDLLVDMGLLVDDCWPHLHEMRVRGRPTRKKRRAVIGGEFWTCEIQDCDQDGNPT